MKKYLILPLVTAFCFAASLPAQERPSAAATKPTGDYASDIGAVLEAEEQALTQARQLLEPSGNTRDKSTLETAIKEMERARAALVEAKKSPDKLPAALTAEQAAYQALLKALPREYRMGRSRNRGQSGSSSGQPNQEEMNQLELTGEANRYETERQAAAAQTPQQKERAQTVDRLKQLARRQQDLNERLRDLQTALQEAKTDREREDVQRQLKRLRDEERQVLSDVDELRQQMEQSPDASRQAETRQQLEQTRNDVQSAAQNLEKQSVSEALASGARAEQKLQTLRETMRQQTSSQFTRQMRELRNQGRELADKENQIARGLDALNGAGQKQLDDSAQRRSLAEQMGHQQTALTNLLGEMRAVTEQAETVEPLLSKQLYDIVRRADQMRTENQLDVGAQLVERGFLPQATQMEHAANKNIDELHQGIDRAAESVLGSEADALRYAQKELDDLARQVTSELSASTNAAGTGGRGNARSQGGTNSPAMPGQPNGNNRGGTNAVAGANSQTGPGEQSQAQAQGQGEAKNQAQGRGQTAGKNNGEGQSAGQAQANNEPDGPSDTQSPGRNGQNRPGNNQGQRSGQSQQAGNSQNDQNPASTQGETSQQAGSSDGGKESLRQFAQQLGGANGGAGLNNGPITGNNFMDWTDRLRDVEQAVNSQDVRNQLATVRERVAVYRRYFRENRQAPSPEELRNKVLAPLALARDWVGQELSRAQNDRSLVPLDRDPVQEKYSDLVRKYYEKLGSAQ